jgi:dTDP-4-amino-4,6-dideoxygalactose transaminase
MAAARETAPSAAPAPVPMLDVNRQNAPLAGEIDRAMAEVVRTGAFINGPACRDLEEAFAKYVGVEHAIGCASGSDALLLPLMALGIGPGDEVLCPSFTFFATAGAVWRLGARPVFVDILPDSMNIDPADAERRATRRTKAIIPVHLFGQSADMESLGRLARERGWTVVEDACQAIGSTCGGRQVGSIGEFGAFSFYPTKNLGGFGDGGMITTTSAEHAETMRRLRNHGQHPRYYHHLVGLNSRLDALQAAVLNVKLPHVDRWAAARSEKAARYTREFSSRDLGDFMTLPTVASGVTSVWNQYTVRVHNGRRDALQEALTAAGIGSAIYYPVPLHLQACFNELGHRKGDLPVTERAADEVLSLPMFPEMTDQEQSRVIECVASFAKNGKAPTRPTTVVLPHMPVAGANIDLPSVR